MISAFLLTQLENIAQGMFRTANTLRGATNDGRCALACQGCDATAYCTLRTAMLTRRDFG